MKKNIFALILMIVPVFAWALDIDVSLNDKISSLNLEASASGEGAVIRSLSVELGISEDVIIKRKMSTGLDWGNLAVALYISHRSGKDISIVVSDFKKGHAWGRIAKAHGVRTDTLLTMMGKAHAASKQGRGQGKGRGKGR